MWVEVNKDASAGVWEVVIWKTPGFEFIASNDLEQPLQTLQGTENLTEPFVETESLRILQNHLRHVLPPDGVSPSQIEALVVCVLTIPVILFEVTEKDGEQGVCTKLRDCIIVLGGKGSA